jgi:hypothetical protein
VLTREHHFGHLGGRDDIHADQAVHELIGEHVEVPGGTFVSAAWRFDDAKDLFASHGVCAFESTPEVIDSSGDARERHVLGVGVGAADVVDEDANGHVLETGGDSDANAEKVSSVSGEKKGC